MLVLSLDKACFAVQCKTLETKGFVRNVGAIRHPAKGALGILVFVLREIAMFTTLTLLSHLYYAFCKYCQACLYACLRLNQ